MQPCKPSETCSYLHEPICESLRSGLGKTFTYDDLVERFQCASGKFCCQNKPKNIIKGECEGGTRSSTKYSTADTSLDCLEACEKIQGKVYFICVEL